MLLYLLLGIACGAAICFFYLRSKPHPAENELNVLRNDKAILNERSQSLERENASLKLQLDSARTEIRTKSEDVARSQALLKAEQENYERLQHDSDEVREQLRREFENLANRILEEKTEKFTKLNQTSLTDILSPLKTKLAEFEQKVESTYRSEAAERNSLRGEIKNLVDLNQQISKEATNLSRALKGDAKQQGNWGELILEKVLEYSGLRKGEEYKTQENFTGEDGRQRPDVVVFLPDNRHIIIDSKVSLTAYERCISATTDDERESALQAHIASVRSHIKGLAEKSYQNIAGLNQPDFVLLFMPIESSFGLAIQADNDLFAFAWEKKIVIVSPSTLLATLRTISAVWKQERQTRNALDIADRAGKMYDKFVGFMEDLVGVGKKMDEAKKGYEGAMNKLTSGSGNLVRQSEQLKEMGAKATKALPQTLIDRSE